MTDKEKIADAIKNAWMKDIYIAYRNAYRYYDHNFTGCLSYHDWIAIRIDLYKPDLYKKMIIWKYM